MKLNDIYEKLRRWNIPGIHLKSVKGSQDSIRVENLVNFKSFLDDVEQIPAFKAVVRALKQTALYLSSTDQITMDRKDFKEIYKLHAKLLAFVEVLCKTLGDSLEKAGELQLVLKLSDPDDMEQMLKNLKTVQAVLSIILINDCIHGKVKIESWDVVAGEVTFYVGSPLAMQLVGSISQSAALVCQKKREGQCIYEYLRDLNVKDESLRDIYSGHDEAVQNFVVQESEKVFQAYFGRGKNPDQSKWLKTAIVQFAELFEHGTEIHPARNAPDKVRCLFPSLNDVQPANSQIKPICEAA